jgi:hypothetical protein
VSLPLCSHCVVSKGERGAQGVLQFTIHTPDDDPSFIVLTETKFSFRCIPVWDRYSPHRLVKPERGGLRFNCLCELLCPPCTIERGGKGYCVRGGGEEGGGRVGRGLGRPLCRTACVFKVDRCVCVYYWRT